MKTTRIMAAAAVIVAGGLALRAAEAQAPGIRIASNKGDRDA